MNLPKNIEPYIVITAISTYTGAGALSQATKKGWLGKVIDVIWPF